MPLWTILTKWPAPLGPQCSQPRSAVVVSPVMPVGAWRRVEPGRERLEDRGEVGDGVVVAADHQAVAALEPEDAAAGAAVDVVDPALGQPRGGVDVVAVVGVAAVDDHVALAEQRRELVDRAAA